MTTYDRILNQGTLSEPKGVPNPEYSFPSTLYWMRGLQLRVTSAEINPVSAKDFYKSVNKKTASDHEINTTLEQLLFALHQCSGLHALKNVARTSDIARVGIVAWYYGIYAAASAMVVAQDSSFPDNHAGTAKAWGNQISAMGLIPHPFDLRITTLVKKDAEIELDNLSRGAKFPLIHVPDGDDDAYGACLAYLSGTVGWLRWKVEEEVRDSKEFKNLGVDNFRTKDAQILKNERLKKKTACFLHQAFRYRGKANYREALFLGYGSETDKMLTTRYIDDLCTVLNAFVCLAGIFCSRRLGKDIWKPFVDDLEENRSFTLSPHTIWGNV